MRILAIVFLLCLPAFAQTPSTSHDASKITEIYLEMARGTTGLDDSVGREFLVTFRRDGTARYRGRANVGLIGDFTGKISAADFDKLASYLVEKKYYRISDELPQRIRDNYPNSVRITGYDSPVVLTGVMYDGKPKFIKRETIVTNDRKNSIPKEIFAIEDAITEAATKIKWTKVK